MKEKIIVKTLHRKKNITRVQSKQEGNQKAHALSAKKKYLYREHSNLICKNCEENSSQIHGLLLLLFFFLLYEVRISSFFLFFIVVKS